MAVVATDRNRRETLMTPPRRCDIAAIDMSTDAASQTRTTTLNAFGFWPASASRIMGLGGKVVDPDPNYAFHSNYAEIGTGIVNCALRFERLEAAVGLLTIRVNGLPPGPGARAETIRTWTASLRDLAEGEGIAEVSFQASAGTRYAVLGHIYDETDARSHELEITLTTEIESASSEQRAATRKSIFGRRVFRRATRMFLPEAADLGDPVSQACTAAQFDEPAYARWVGEMKAQPVRHRRQWESAYTLQALWRYGMLRPGARGLGFGVGVAPLPAVMAAHGCTVVASDLPADDARDADWERASPRATSIESFRFPEICADEVFDRQVSFRPVDMTNVPLDLAGFDFIWSAGALQHLGTIEAGQAFIRNSVGCLTYGGLGVFTTDFNVSSNLDTIDNEGSVLFRKQDLEKVAVELVSRGHYVAQFKYDLGATALDKVIDVPPYRADEQLKLKVEDYVATSFGIIVRRGDR